MAIKKISQLTDIDVENIIPLDQIISKNNSDDAIAARFKKVAESLRSIQSATGKKLAPKIDDFTYGVCLMLHAAESALINQDTGEPILNKQGQPVKGWFENTTDGRGRPTVKWSSPDGIMPTKNQNGDIFPEEDLIKYHKDWIGKPLCKDHISNTVDGVRGIIVDAFYDAKFKRVHGLFALDKKNYPELARKVEAGYQTSVSMGTAVGRAICFECSNVATVEAEYCHHAKTKTSYGEVNKDLSPIELSLVVTGADPRAKIRMVLAHLNTYVDNKEREFALSGKNPAKDSDIAVISKAASVIDTSDLHSLDDQTLVDLARQMRRLNIDGHQDIVDVLINKIESEKRNVGKDELAKVLSLIDVGDTERIEKIKSLLVGGEKALVNPRDEGKLQIKDTSGYSLNDLQPDELGTGDLLPTERTSGEPIAAFTSFYDRKIKKATKETKTGRIETVLFDSNKERPMNFAELKERSLRRRNAYHQGTEPPQKYPLMGDQDKIRDTQDKQMVGDELDTSVDNPDAKIKEMVQRASLEERRARRAALVMKAKQAAGEVTTYKVDGKDVKTMKGVDGKEKALVMSADDGETKEAKEKNEKLAYFQGTEEPSPGKRRYAPMGDSDKIRNTLDKQMSGEGMEGGSDGMHPGYGGKSDESVKRYWQRMASLKAKRHLGSNIKEASWDVFADGLKVLTVRAADVYEGALTQKIAEVETDKTYGEFFASEDYGKELLNLVRQAAGPEGAAQALNLPAALPAAEPAMTGGEQHVDDKSKEGLVAARDKVLESLSAVEDAVEDIREALGFEDLKDVNVDVEQEVPANEALPAAPAPASPAMAAVENELIKVYALLKDASTELAVLQSELGDGNASVLSDTVDAVRDAEAVVAHYNSNLSVFAAKKKKMKEEDDEVKGKGKAKDKGKDKDKPKAKGKDGKDDKDAKEKDMKGGKAKEKDGKGKGKEEMPFKGFKKKKSNDELLAELLQVRSDRRENIVRKAFGELDDEFEENDTQEGMYPTEEADGGREQPLTEDEIDNLLEEYEAAENAPDAETLEHIGHDTDMPAYDMTVSDHTYQAKDADEGLNSTQEEEVEEIAEEEATDKVEEHEADPKMHSHDESKEKLASKRAWRAAIAAKVSDLNETYSGVRGKEGQGTTVKFDAKVSDGLNIVENLHTQHAKDMAVATQEATKSNVRMAAEMLNKLITKGAIKASELDRLVSEGTVDADAAKYWKEYWGQVDSGKEFAAGMVKEYKQSKSAGLDTEAREIKLRRAYALGLQAQDKGIISRARAELEKYVDSLMRYPDEAFDSMKNVVAQMVPVKTATAAPQVGINYDTDESYEPTVRTAGSASPSVEDLSRLFG